MFGLSLTRLAIYAAIVLALTAALTWAVHAYNESVRDEGRAEVRAEWKAAVKVADDREAIAAENRRIKQETADAIAFQTLSRIAADAASARNAADSLRTRLAAYVAAGRNPGQAQPAAGPRPSQQGSDPLDVLANLFSRADGTAGELASYADALRAAGQRCEAGYDAEVAP